MMKKQAQNLESLSIWCEYPSEDQNTVEKVDKADLHLNYWKVPRPDNDSSGRLFTRCLDMGVRLHKPGGASSICYYFPFKLDKEDISDLGAILGESKKVCCAVFNENCVITHTGDSKHVTIEMGEKGKDNEKKFDLYPLESEQFDLEEKYGGTVLRIKLPEKRENNLYTRIRIKTPNLKSICTVNNLANSFLQSAFSKDEFIDFRLNEYRVLNNSLIEDIEKHGRLTLETVHFFFICSHDEEHVFASTPYNNCRFLESGTWEEYVSPQMPQLKGVSPLAYHWKSPKDKPGFDYSVLVKTRYQTSTWRGVCKYLVVFLLISVISGLLSATISDRLFSKEEVRSTVSTAEKGEALEVPQKPAVLEGQTTANGQSQ